ncbi:MAG: DUF433 domain-containing protein [Planctomycetes bacterium]|nr:DUF433 domain-containing protein [Planctomycetota bacterium]
MCPGTTVERRAEILGEKPAFAGTRVPARTLVDYLEAGDRIDDFLEDYPGVTRDQPIALLEPARDALPGDARADR